MRRADIVTQFLGRISMSVLTLLAIILVSFTLFSVIAHHWLDGSYIAPDNKVPNYFRNLAEIGSFLANVTVVLVGSIAVFVARYQSNLSLLERRSHLYLTLSEKLTKPILNGNEICKQIASQQGVTPSALLQFAMDEINGWPAADHRHETLLELIIALENIGLMVRRDYLDMDDVYYLLAGRLREIDATLRLYLLDLQEKSSTKRRCEHAIWLLRKVWDHTPRPLKV